MIEIRRITAEELLMTRRIEAVVFNARHDFSKEEKPDELANPPEWKWATFEDGKMTSSLVEIPYTIRFDGRDARMSGIGGVGTLPEARRGGKVRRIFEKMLPEEYEKGYVFSCLTPFSHAFYRMFGYELCCARSEIRVATRHFERQKLRGTFRPMLPGDDLTDLKAIHAAYIDGLNQGIRRDDWPDDRAWKRFLRDDPIKSGVFVYAWYDETGKPGAYIEYQDVKEGDHHNMFIRELSFTGSDALRGVLSIISGLGSQFREMVWPVMPTFLDPMDFIDHMWEVEQKINPRDMTRVINVKAALEAMRRPRGEGSYTIEVADPLIGANAGRYLVEYGPEGTRVAPTAKDADMACDIPSLSQLVLGYRTIDNALRTRPRGLEVSANLDTLREVFTLRPQHVTEYF